MEITSMMIQTNRRRFRNQSSSGRRGTLPVFVLVVAALLLLVIGSSNLTIADDSLSNTNHNYADRRLKSDTANHHLRRALLFGFGEEEKSEEDGESTEAQEAAAEDEDEAAAEDETEEGNQSDSQTASETESDNNDPKDADNAEDGAEETAVEEDANGETNDSTDADAVTTTESEDTATTEETAAAEGGEQDSQTTNSADDAAAAGDETSTEGNNEEEESTEAASKEETQSSGDNESDGDATTNDETKDEDDNSGGEDTANQSEDKEPLPFLTDSDLECLDTTASLVASNKALKSAIELFENSQILKDEDNHPGIMVLGHSSDQVNAMRSACALRAKNGQTHWAFVESQHLECVIEGMETISMHVHNYGKCLAMIEPCVSMDPIHLIQKDLVGLGYNCWPEDNDDGNGAEDSESGSSPGEVNSSSSSTSEAATSTTAASGDDQASENEGDATKEEEESEPSTEENEDSGSSSNSSSNSSANNQQCLDDTREMIRNISSLSDANDDYFNSKTVDLSGDNPTLTFDETKAKNFQKACQQAQGISKTSFEIDLSCEMMKEKVTLEINNVAFCLANTKYCGSMDDIKAMTTLIQDAWTTMGLTCATPTMDDDKNGSSSSGSNSSSGSSSSGSANDDSEESALAKTLGLSDTDVACLDASTDFIDSDPDLKNATSVFMKSLNTSDPNRLGYPKEAVEQMHDVCGEYNGVYIGGATQDLICRNNKKQRCISTYNFGACVASTNECQSMNPFVMTKIFLWEVMNLKCSLAESSCEVYNKNNPNTNKNGGNHNSSGNLSSPQQQQQQPNGIGSGSALPSLPMIVTGLAIVGALGFFGLKKYRAQRQVRQRRTQEAYEMTQISDLGFKVFT